MKPYDIFNVKNALVDSVFYVTGCVIFSPVAIALFTDTQK
jgi:hypothetical protein